MIIAPKIVLVTKRTRLEGLTARFNTQKQARFYIEHMQQDFSAYEQEHEIYVGALKKLKHDLCALDAQLQVIDRDYLPNFVFASHDVVVTVGPDGLVVNTAKYLESQPIVAVNPDPTRIDGILLPFAPDGATVAIARALNQRADCHRITMAEVRLNDGQRLLAFNDFLVGQRSHVSARYKISWNGQSENQSSSGVLVSTGAGSTGWLSSTQNMAASLNHLLLADAAPPLPTLRLAWDDPRLVFVVREPFSSKASGVKLSAGMIEAKRSLVLESQMPEGGVIFSDGIEADAIAFNSGAVATIQASSRQALLVKND